MILPMLRPEQACLLCSCTLFWGLAIGREGASRGEDRLCVSARKSAQDLTSDPRNSQIRLTPNQRAEQQILEMGRQPYPGNACHQREWRRKACMYHGPGCFPDPCAFHIPPWISRLLKLPPAGAAAGMGLVWHGMAWYGCHLACHARHAHYAVRTRLPLTAPGSSLEKRFVDSQSLLLTCPQEEKKNGVTQLP